MVAEVVLPGSGGGGGGGGILEEAMEMMFISPAGRGRILQRRQKSGK